MKIKKSNLTCKWACFATNPQQYPKNKISAYIVKRRHHFSILLAQAARDRNGERLMIRALLQTTLRAQVVLLLQQCLGHLLHARVRISVRRPSMNIVAELRVRHDKHAYIRHTAKVNELSNHVTHTPNINEVVNQVLDKSERNIDRTSHADSEHATVGCFVQVHITDKANVAVSGGQLF